MNIETLELIVDESIQGTQAYRDAVLLVDRKEKSYAQWSIHEKLPDGAHIWKKGLHYIYSHKGRCKLYREPLNEFLS